MGVACIIGYRLPVVFDAIFTRTHGFLTARDVRVVWKDGTLYVCKTPTDIAAFQTDAPVKRGGYYHVQMGEATLRLQPPGCGSCRRRIQQSPVGRMTVDDIVAAVAHVDA